jgi:hypothetical protein
MPFGPKELRTLSDTTLAAVMFPCKASFPRDLFEPSFKTMIGIPPACVGNDDKSVISFNSEQQQNVPSNISFSRQGMINKA